MDNLKAISIFTSYFLSIFLLLSLVLSSLYRASTLKAKRNKSAIIIFTFLALASLGSTWYYMGSYFRHSYVRWALRYRVPKEGLRLGDWLKDVKLFKEAWEAVVVTPERWWWSQQIFLGTCGWSVFMGAEGHRRGIKHLWAYMLLGQLVAISFVTNLFFLSILVYPPPPSPPSPPAPIKAPRPGSKLNTPPVPIKSAKPVSRSNAPPDTTVSSKLYSILFSLPLLVSYACIYITPYTAWTAAFLPTVLIPHLLLFLPFSLPQSKVGRQFWRIQYGICSFMGFVLHAKALRDIFSAALQSQKTFFTAIALFMKTQTPSGVVILSLKSGVKRILQALLHEHPAVSSVGWDVIMFSLSLAAWGAVRGTGLLGYKASGRWVDVVLGCVDALFGWVMMVIGGVGVGAEVFAREL
ncbi:hypothetical protein RUND412_007438 [Rhizina undulata]